VTPKIGIHHCNVYSAERLVTPPKVQNALKTLTVSHLGAKLRQLPSAGNI
jgi:hypothetical protein